MQSYLMVQMVLSNVGFVSRLENISQVKILKVEKKQ
jgi:hypothetical protein